MALENFKQVSNPLTVIAIFAGLSEISMTVALPFVSPELQWVFIWFIMVFPTVLILLFFATLNFNHRVLYAPSDFRDDSSFIDAMKYSRASGTLNEAAANIDMAVQALEGKGKDGASHEIKVLKESKENLVEARNDLIRTQLTRSQEAIFDYLRGSFVKDGTTEWALLDLVDYFRWDPVIVSKKLRKFRELGILEHAPGQKFRATPLFFEFLDSTS